MYIWYIVYVYKSPVSAVACPQGPFVLQKYVFYFVGGIKVLCYQHRARRCLFALQKWDRLYFLQSSYFLTISGFLNNLRPRIRFLTISDFSQIITAPDKFWFRTVLIFPVNFYLSYLVISYILCWNCCFFFVSFMFVVYVSPSNIFT